MIKNTLKKFLEFILFGNVFISFGAVCLLWETNLLLQKSVRLDGLALMIFFSTLFVYTGHRLLAVRNIPKENHGYILQWARRNSFLLTMILLIGGGGFLNALFHLEPKTQLTIIILGAISVLYQLTVIRIGGKLRSLRNLGMLKIFWITLVWTVSTTLLPVFEYGVDWTNPAFYPVILRRIFFIFSVSLCFDLRDEVYDRAEGLRTIPIVFGEAVTKRLYWICMVGAIASGIGFFFLSGYHDWGTLAAIVIGAVMSYQLMLKARLFTSEYYYPLVVDGLLVLQFIWILFGA